MRQHSNHPYSPRKSPLAAGIAALLGTVVTTTFAVGAFAQESAPNRLLEEVMVFAQKKEQSVLEVPVSVASYSNEALDLSLIHI